MKKALILALGLIVMVFGGCNNAAGTVVPDDPARTDAATPAATIGAGASAQSGTEFTLSGDTAIMKSGVRVSDCEEYFTWKYPEMIRRLGSGYDVVMTGPEASWQSYHYESLGIAFVYNDYEYALNDAPLMWIDCDPDKIDLNGVREDMSFSEIQQILGPGETKTSPYEDVATLYELIYRVGHIGIVFHTYSQDAEEGWWLTVEYDYQ